MRHGLRLALAALFALISATAQAQVTTAQTGHLVGPDRMQLLIAGAKKEGALSLYTSTSVDDMGPVVAAFEKRYGVKVNVWRGASVDILQRVQTETRAGRYAVDVVENPGSELEALAREKVLQEVALPVFADLMPGAAVKGRPWVATRLLIFTIVYNTNLIRKADLPKRYEDLLAPKWKGKLGIEATDANWFMSLVRSMGEEKGLKLFRDIAATNGFSARQGHTLLVNLVASGEVPLAINGYRHFTQQLKRAGAPVEELYLPPVLAVASGGAVAAKAPHPYAAVLFLDFLLGDGQKILASRDSTPSNLAFQRLPAGIRPALIDVPGYVDEGDKWRRLFKEVTSIHPR